MGQTSLNHLIGAQQKCFGDCQAQRLSRLQVDQPLELSGLLDGKITNLLGSFENLVDENSRAAKHQGIVWSIGHERTIDSHFPAITYQWQSVLDG
jgi:hypothetical protein